MVRVRHVVEKAKERVEQREEAEENFY